MISRLSFRQRFFLAQTLILILFLLLLVVFTNHISGVMLRRTYFEISHYVVDRLKQQPDVQHMVEYLDNQETYVFLFQSLIDENLKVLYENYPTHPNKEGMAFIPEKSIDLAEARQTGRGYYIGWSPVYRSRFASVSLRFDFQGDSYYLLLAFPYAQAEVLKTQLRQGLFTVHLAFMVFFMASLWFAFSRLSRPIREMANTIRPYSAGKTENIPRITIEHNMGYEFDYLASTLNSLSKKVQEQIEIVTAERNEKEAILESLMEGVIAVDHEGIIRYANHTAAKMVQMMRRQLLGAKLMPSQPHPRAELLSRCHAMARLAQESSSVVTDSIALSEGQKIYLDLIAVPKPQEMGAIIVLQDKSSQYKVVEMGKDFIANASHELRTPITIIKGFAETLQDLPKISPTMLAEITEKIVRNCQRMDTLVKNLLTLSDIENVPETRFQSCDVIALAENCQYLILTLAPDARVDIEKADDHILVEADPDLLELCIMNLLENGIKYSKPPIHLTISLEQTENDVIINIQDRGIGIPEDSIPHLFERFYTVDKARSRQLGGAGLGLSIVHTIIEKHEGLITVYSKVGEGTTFTITLPKKRSLLH